MAARLGGASRRASLALALLGSGAAAAGVDARPALAAACTKPAPSVAGFGAAIDARRNTSWTAADLTSSINLTDGRRLWLYGDTITSGLAPGGPGVVSSTFTARNSAMVQDKGCFTPLLNGAADTASSWIPELGDQWSWPGDGYARGGTVWLWATRLTRVSSGLLGFEAQAVDLVEIDQATMAIRAVHRNRYAASPILLGGSVTTDGIWTYLWGRDELGTKRHTYVARVPAANPRGATTYWTGTTWSASPANARPIFTTEVIGGPAFADLGPVYGDKRYVAVVMDGEFLTTKLEVYHGPGPAGPWQKAMTMEAPALAGDGTTWSYMAGVHGVDTATGGLHVTWNINSFDTAAVTRDVHAYTEIHRSLPVNLRVPAGAPAVPSAQPVGAPGGLVPVTPRRVLDTRIGLGGLPRLAAGAIYALPVAAWAGLPAEASGVVATFTAVSPAALGYLTVWPCGGSPPVASSLNFRAGDVVANTLLPTLGAGRAVCVVASQAVDLLVDVAAYLSPGGAGFVGVIPARLLDTRAGGVRVAAGATSAVHVAGTAGVPPRSRAVALNVTATASLGAGFVTAWPCDEPRPNTSIVNVMPGVDRADNAVVPLLASGDVCLSPSVPMHLVVDVHGAYASGGGLMQGTVPLRRLDTRVGQGGYGRPGAGQSLTLPVAGHHGIPAGAKAVRVNLTAATPLGATFVTAYPCSRWVPAISNLNTEPASPAQANEATVPLGPGGQLCLNTATAATHLLVDITGYVV